MDQEHTPPTSHPIDMGIIKKDENVWTTRAPAEYNASSDQVYEKRQQDISQENVGSIHEDWEVKADTEQYSAKW